MFKTIRTLTVLLLVIFSTSFATDNNPFARYPSVNSNGTQISFSFQGDIWTMPISGGRALRLTVHQAFDGTPKWSPDDKTIAFSSNRFGNDDIYTIPSQGGRPNRLTYFSASDDLNGWTPNGYLLFETRRIDRQIEWENELFSVSSKGGTPTKLINSFGYMASVSPNGRYIAFVKGACRITREQYKGPANRNIWLYDTKNKTYNQLTTFEGQDIYPDWGDNSTIYFLSALNGRYNIYKLTIDENGNAAGNPVQLTNFTENGIRNFDVSFDGSTIVFEKDNNIYSMKTSGGQTSVIKIDVTDDYHFYDIEHKTYTGRINNYSVSPNGKYIALEVHGEIFITQNDKAKKRTVNLSNNSFRDTSPAWLNDTTLIFVSDRTGERDIYLVSSADKNESDLFKSLKHTIKKITDTDEDEFIPVISPDKMHIAYTIGRGKLVTADISKSGGISNTKTLLDGWATPQGVTWSPDSKWLAYSLPDLDFNDEIYIHAADNSKPHVNVSMHPRGDYNPFWSKDGSKLGFISNRNNGDDDVWFVWLNKKDWEKTKQDWEEDEPSKPSKDKKDKDSKSVNPLTIDFTEIYKRLEQVTSLPGNESDLVISDDGNTFYFVAYRNTNQNYKTNVELYSIKWDGTKLNPLTKGNQKPYGVSIDDKGKDLYFLKSGGRLNGLNLKSKKQYSLSFTAKLDIDHPKERNQIFEEAWRTLRDGFYDPDFHGKDFNELKTKYKPWALATSTDTDFHEIFNYMLGELNASHMGLYGGDRAETQKESTGLLGITIQPLKEGVLVTHVVPNSPADRLSSKLKEGDIIISVDGTTINSSMNFYSALINRQNEKLLLTVKDKNGNNREVAIRPTNNSLRSKLYDEWVNSRKELVNKYSNGRLGYIHIQGMNWRSFEVFERELTAAGLGKDGIVIDVRYNGGGWTTDYLMTVLTYRQHAYTIPRGAAKDLKKEQTKFVSHYPFGERLPFAAWTKPSIALCNENSYSNAEIFSHAYKTLGLGKLVGKPTFGAVISTGGRGLIDGSFVRLPFRGWYVKATKKNMEWGPAVPDIIVEDPPDAKAKGIDPQLKRAVDELLKEL